MKMWLDDMRKPPKDFVWVKTAKEAIGWIDQGIVEFIDLDHDLGEGDGTGYEVAAHIEAMAWEGRLKPMGWAVHSMNPVGANRMRAAMVSAQKAWKEKGCK